MSTKFLGQIGLFKSVLIIFAEFVVLYFTLGASLFVVLKVDLNSVDSRILFCIVFLTLHTLPPLMFRGRSLGLLLFKADIHRNGYDLSKVVIFLRSIFFYPVFISYSLGILRLWQNHGDAPVDPLFKCYFVKRV